MSICLPIPKLAAVLTPNTRFKSALLRHRANADWDQDISYLRELYNQTTSESESKEKGEGLYRLTEPKVREILLVLKSVADSASGTQNAVHDFETAVSQASSGYYDLANVYLSYALSKVHKQIIDLSRMETTTTKLGYGYDVSGEGGRGGGGTSGDGRHLWDTGNSPKHDHTQSNPANMLVDAEAESDYPELAKFKHKRVHWPPRIR